MTASFIGWPLFLMLTTHTLDDQLHKMGYFIAIKLILNQKWKEIHHNLMQNLKWKNFAWAQSFFNSCMKLRQQAFVNHNIGLNTVQNSQWCFFAFLFNNFHGVLWIISLSHKVHHFVKIIVFVLPCSYMILKRQCYWN